MEGLIFGILRYFHAAANRDIQKKADCCQLHNVERLKLNYK